MTEFTDGTAKGKTLSLVELEKRLEALPTTDKVNALIKQAIADLLNSGDVAVNGTKFEQVITKTITDSSAWSNNTYKATKSGWYSLYCKSASFSTPSGYISVFDDGQKQSRANGNGARDICAGPIWVKAGETILYGCIGFQLMILQATTREV